MSNSWGKNMISSHLLILLFFVILKCFIFDLSSEQSEYLSYVFLIGFSVYFLIYLGIWNIKLTKSNKICGPDKDKQSERSKIAGYATIFSYIFIYVIGILLISIFPGWIRGFSNTFGLTVIQLCGYDSYIEENIQQPPNDGTNNIYNKIYSNPNLFINELNINSADFNTKIEQISIEESKKENFIKQIKKYITVKETIGTYIWVGLLSVFTILMSQNAILNERCNQSIIKSNKFQTYLTSQLQE